MQVLRLLVIVVLLSFLAYLLPVKVSAVTVSYGSSTQIHTDGNPVTYVSTAALDSNKFVYAYRDDRNSSYGTVVVGSVTDGEVTFGQTYVFSATSTNYIDVVPIDSTHFAIVYSASSDGKAIIGTVSGSSISFGSEATFDVDALSTFSARLLDSTHLIVSYRAYSSGYLVRSVVGTISGTSLSFGSTANVASNSLNDETLSTAVLDSTHFIVFYENSDDGKMALGTVSGTSISFGSETTFRASDVYAISANALDSTHAVVSFRDPFDNNNATFAMVITESSGTLTANTKYLVSTDIASTTYAISISPISSTTFVLSYARQSTGVGKSYIGTVSNGTELSFGSGATYDNGGAIQYMQTSLLDSTHFVIGYRDFNAGNRATAIVSSISGTTITHGDKYTIDANEGDVGLVSTAALDATHFVAAYADASSNGKATIGTVTGTNISFGSSYLFNTTSDYVAVAALSSTSFVVVYKDTGSSNYGRAMIGTVSGSTISFGSEYVFNASTTDFVSVAALSSTSFAVAYKDTGGSNYGRAVVGTVSGTTITFGSEYAFNSATTDYVAVTPLDSTHFVATYRDTGSSSYGRAAVGEVSDTTVSFGSEYAFNSATTNYLSVAKMNSSTFVVSYQDAGNSSYGTLVYATVSDDVITFDSESVFNAATTTIPSIAALSADQFVVGYRNNTTILGMAVVGGADTTAPSVSTLSPQDGATDVALDANLIITFDEAVDAEVGNITIKRASNDSIVEAIDVTGGQVTGSGSTTITVNPSNSLSNNTSYYVQIDATAFDDAAGNSFAGIANSTTWNFTTVNTVTPTATPTSTSTSTAQAVSSAQTNATECRAEKPNAKPDLFQITTTNSTATVYFTPVNNTSEYYISYSTNPSAEEHGAQIVLGSAGVQNYTIKQLSPGTTYYFKVRGANGCAAGEWSDSKPATTIESDSATTVTQQVTRKIDEVLTPKMEITDIAVETPKPALCSYTVKSGDTLWNIATDVYGAGTHFRLIVEQNKEKYPSIANLLSVGMDLSFDCELPPDPTQKPEEVTHDVTIKIENGGKPLADALVELHSDPKSGRTNKNGEVTFTNVEKGEHTLKIAYLAYSAEQKLTVDGVEKQVNVALKVTLRNSILPTEGWVLLVAVLLGIIVLLVVKLHYLSKPL